MKFLFYFYLCLTGIGFVQPTFADSPTTWKGQADITFSGTSTLHDWSGKVSAKPFTTTVMMNDAGQPTAIVAEVKVEAGSMDTAEPKRDENMHQAMHVSEHPLIVANLNTPYNALSPKSESVPQKLPFKISLLGKAYPVEGVVSNWQKVGNKATFEVDFDVSLKASDIKVPSVLLVIRVGDTVKVHVNVTLIQTQA